MIHIAKRFIFSNKIQTIFIILGIAVGVAVQFFIAILIDSLQANLVDTTVGSSPHIIIEPSEEMNYIEIEKDLILDLERNDKITKIQKEYQENVFVNTDDEKIDTALILKGIEFDLDTDIYKINESIVEGDLPIENEVLIGLDFSKEENINVNDSFMITYSDGQSEEVSISGIFDLGNATLNNRWMLTDLEWVQQNREKENRVTSINLQVLSVFDADLIATNIAKIKSIEKKELVVSNWKDANSQLLSGLQSQSISSVFIQVFVLISVIIGIISVLNILVIQKSREIGILKAIGLKDNQSGQIFVIQSAFLGTLGTVVGVLLGLGLFYTFLTFVKTDSGESIVQPVIKWQFFFMSAVINILVSTISGLIPAFKTARLDPVDIINNG